MADLGHRFNRKLGMVAPPAKGGFVQWVKDKHIIKRLVKWLFISGLVALLPIWWVCLRNVGVNVTEPWPVICRNGELILIASVLVGESIIQLLAAEVVNYYFRLGCVIPAIGVLLFGFSKFEWMTTNPIILAGVSQQDMPVLVKAMDERFASQLNLYIVAIGLSFFCQLFTEETK
jgi:hypothetical protein